MCFKDKADHDIIKLHGMFRSGNRKKIGQKGIRREKAEKSGKYHDVSSYWIGEI